MLLTDQKSQLELPHASAGGEHMLTSELSAY